MIKQVRDGITPKIIDESEKLDSCLKLAWRRFGMWVPSLNLFFSIEALEKYVVSLYKAGPWVYPFITAARSKIQDRYRS